MTSVSLYVELKAKSGKEEEVAAFLAGAQSLVAAEPGTVAWFAVRFDKSTFAIFDAFNDKAAREAHLSGQVAAALMTCWLPRPRFANRMCLRTSCRRYADQPYRDAVVSR
jgi:quinol monooxygenase YgiN